MSESEAAALSWPKKVAALSPGLTLFLLLWVSFEFAIILAL